jgi:hypothetical protein
MEGVCPQPGHGQTLTDTWQTHKAHLPLNHELLYSTSCVIISRHLVRCPITYRRMRVLEHLPDGLWGKNYQRADR